MYDVIGKIGKGVDLQLIYQRQIMYQSIKTRMRKISNILDTAPTYDNE